MAREDRIRARAHEIWELEGRPAGRERQHWERARQEVEEGTNDTQDDLQSPSGVNAPQSTDEPLIIEKAPGPLAGERDMGPVDSDEALDDAAAEEDLGPVDPGDDIVPTTSEEDTDSPALSDEAADTSNKAGSPTTQRLAERRDSYGSKWPEGTDAGVGRKTSNPERNAVSRRPRGGRGSH